MNNIKVRFNERELSRSLFELKDEKVRKFALDRTFYDGNTQAILRFALKYLLHVEHRNPYELESFIRKYEVVLIYAYLNKIKGINVFYDPGFEYILEGGITYNKIDHAKFNKHNGLVNIFNNLESEDSYDKLIKKVEKIISPFYKKDKKPSLNKTEYSSIINFLHKDKKFFYSYRMNFDNIFESHTRNNDMLIAETLADRELYDFELEILEEDLENYHKNFYDDLEANYMDKYGPFIFGYLVYIPVLHDDLKMIKPVKLMNSITLRLNLNDKHCAIKTKVHPSLFKFINAKQQIDKDNIIPFNFVLNGKRYRFSKEGLELI